MLRIDFDITAGLCRIHDRDGHRDINGFHVDASLSTGRGSIIIGDREYKFKEIYINAREMIEHDEPE
jgi:hypothetical protein